MSERRLPDVAKVRAAARREWERQLRTRRPIQERIGNSVPWWLVIVAMVFFALSAPHTVAVFSQITPVFGVPAPFGVEFGLLYFAFRRKQEISRSGKVPMLLITLGILLFATSIVVNGAGSLRAVVASTEDVRDKSLSQLWDQFGHLPATSQVALVLVPMAALIIPIGTLVAGEGLATLFFEHSQRREDRTDLWEIEGPKVEFFALRDAAIRTGQEPVPAARWAAQITGYLPSTLSTGVRALSRTGLGHAAPTASISTGQSEQRTRVREYIEEHGEAALRLSVRQLAERTKVGKSLAAEVRAEMEQEMILRTPLDIGKNGHGDQDING